jgi:CHASE2 domain-containing sensor protein/serine phosphatase RsbU (regulator of sigma subunit)
MGQRILSVLKRWQDAIVVAPLVAGLVMAGSYGGLFRRLEWMMLDPLFRWQGSGPEYPLEQRIAIVTIDELDIQTLGQWPMSDRVMAQLLRTIQSQEPRAIAIDIYRDLPVEPGHGDLVELFEKSTNLIGSEKAAGDPILPPPALAERGQVAANDLLFDVDGQVRRSLILIDKPDGSRIPGLGAKLALLYLQQEQVELEVLDQDQMIWGLDRATLSPLRAYQGEYRPQDMGGYQMLLHYQGQLDHFPHISMTDVLNRAMTPDFFHDRLVLIGAIAPSLNDRYPTPLNAKTLVSGVVIHANITGQILRAALEGRPLLQPLAKPLQGVWVLFWASYSAVLGHRFMGTKRQTTVLGVVFGGLIIGGVGYGAFQVGWLMPLFTPLFTLVSTVVVSIGVTLWYNLKLSYVQLEDYAATLEAKVKARTAALADANAEIVQLNQKLQADNQRMGAELELVRQMQQMILPRPEELAAIAELDIAGYMEPADEVGGDYYDVLQEEGVVTVGIGDVTGHGLESGILMIMTQTAVRTLQEIRETDPVRFLDSLNRTIYKNVQRMNSEKNLSLVILNYAQNRVSISGQHEEILVVRTEGTVERIDTLDLGFPIGLDEEIADFISQTRVTLGPGDGVVLYTDGITEARNLQRQQYQLERLCQVICRNWHHPAEAIKEAVIGDLRQYIGTQKIGDDITLLVLKQR